MSSFKQISTFIIVLLFCPMLVFAQLTIQGKVTDALDEGLAGANIIAKGTLLGTSTDTDGYFKLIIPQPEEQTILEVHFVGYSTERKTITETSGIVTLDFKLFDDVLQLDEIVVTGSRELSKKQLGNTVSTVSGSNIVDARTVDASGALSGKFAGVQVTQNSGDPASGISVRLRSASTVNGSSDPLYIIDGVIVNNTSSDLLGVQSVQQNRLSDINPQDIDRIEVIKGAAAAAIYGSRASNGVVQIFTKKGKTGAPKVTFGSSININSLRKKIDYNDVNLAWEDPGDLTNLNTVSATRYDYQDQVFETSMGTDNYLSVSGGSGNTTYFGSLSRVQNDGIMKNTSFSRNSVRLRFNQVINEWALMSLGTYISNSESNDMPNGGYGRGVLQTILFSDNSIDPKPDADGNYPTMTFYPNILEYLDTYEFKQENNRAISDIQFTLTPYEGLLVNYVLGYDDSRSTGSTYEPIGTTTRTDGYATSSTISRTLINSDLNISYETQLSDDFSSVTGSGYSYQFDKSELDRINAQGLALGVETTDGAATISTSDFTSKRAIWGGYLQQTVGFRDKLFVSGAARLDGSSVFGEDERNQFYPKASLSYIISEESFFKDLITEDIVNNLKLRAAWGRAGNLTAIGPFDRLTNYNAVSIGGLAGLTAPSQIGNKDLKPEQQTEIEFGIDLVMLKNRLGLEFTVYNQEIEDLLVERTLAPSTGAGSRVENIANMTNNGIEIQLTGTPIRSKDLTWTSTLTYSSNKNEVNGIEGEEFGIGNFNFAKAMNGQPLGVFKQAYYARNADGSLLLDANGLPQRERGSVDANGNNIIERDANGQPTGTILQKVIGDPNPDYVASWTNEVKYQNFSFRAQIDAVQGFDVLSWDTRMFYRFGGGAQDAKELQGKATKGTGDALFFIPESYIEDGSFIKLRELSASYLWENPIKGLSSLKFTIAGRNLFSIDDYSKWDPEVNMDAQSNGSRGGIMGLIPIPRTIIFGITITN